MFKVIEAPSYSFDNKDLAVSDPASVKIGSGGCGTFIGIRAFYNYIASTDSSEYYKEYSDREVRKVEIMGEKNPYRWNNILPDQLYLWTNTSGSDDWDWPESVWYTSHTKPVFTEEGIGKIAPPPVKEERTNLKKVLEWLLEEDNAQLLEEAIEYAETIIECPEV